ncbi:acid phosphatase, putative [Bodo saltans]|uniref:Acid phosphatase, putative n=1 Tax=Bodo saltans TaxID=75058 RepID=A0A0S4JT27_BODSA|nr:acid phosphatase, putative [Bodo saltans]|eukprot:CUG93395.1 acid phosphatase, putative [Bodo saltans]
MQTRNILLVMMLLLVAIVIAKPKRENGKKLELVKLIALNRHGHRAPNPPYWNWCPNDAANRFKYDVNMEDLTGLGMQEEYNFGVWLRQHFHDFIGVKFNRTKHFIRAVGEPRVLQSAMAVAQGMFPDGFGPGGFLPGRPQFVPIFSDMNTHEYLLDDVPCFKRATADSGKWVEQHMAEFVKEPKIANALAELRNLCGPIKGDQPSDSSYVKMVVDGVIFNNDYGLKPLGGRVTPELMFELRNISIQMLMQRLYSTDAQQTYTSMDFPETLLGAFDSARKSIQLMDIDDFSHPFQQVEVFVGHREALYALEEFFGFQFEITGLPKGEVPVSTAIIFELLRENDKDFDTSDDFYVRTNVYTPYDGKYTMAYPGCRSPRLCKLSELHKIFKKRVARTGPWRELCNYTEPELDRITGIR